MPRRHVPTVFAFAVVSVLALAGCSSSGDTKTLDPMESPLQEYMSAIYPDMDDDDFAKQQQESEELVAACMTAEGFEYTPVDQSQWSSSSSYSYEEQNTEKWIAENGYGAVQTPEQIEEQNEQSEEYVDPNQPYVESLSPGEQEAYYEVLYGPQATEEEMDDEGSYEYNWETAGCQGAAQHEISGEDPYSDEAYSGLMDSMSEMYTKVESSPVMKEINAEWSSCMADAGYSDFTNKYDAAQSIYDESNELYSSETGEMPTDKALAELREKEIEVALADFKCAEETDYSNKQLEAQFEIEEQFITDNKAELDAMVADYSKGN